MKTSARKNSTNRRINMNQHETKKLAKEIAELCEESVEKRTKRSTRFAIPKVVLQSVIAALLTVPATVGSGDRKSLWD
jgi:hypothetical protein